MIKRLPLLALLVCAAACAVSGREQPLPVQATPAGSSAAAGASAAAAAAPGTTPVAAAGSAAGTATLVGTVAGQALVPASAQATLVSAEGDPSLLLEIGDQPTLCADAKLNTARKGSTALLLLLSAGGAALQATTYTLGTDHDLAAKFYRLDDSCSSTLAAADQTAVSGSVVLTDLQDDGSARGSYTLRIGTQQEALSGTFWAPACAGLQSVLAPPTTCK